MDDTLYIPFAHLGSRGVVKVTYVQNPGPAVSGFDALKGISFDVELCRKYPTVHAVIDTYEGTGYRMGMAWIQLVTRYDEVSGCVATSTSVDGSDAALLPYFSYGYPPSLYDAPCCNLGDSDRLRWVAESFLVTTPTRLTGRKISFLAGFQWGYEEYDYGGERCVNILPAKEIGGVDWNVHVDLLQRTYSHLNFGVYGPE